MAITRVQSATGQGDPATATVTGPTDGDILIALLSGRSDISHTAHTLSDNGGGTNTWAKLFGRDTELGDANARHSISVWWKISDTGIANPVVSGDDGTTGTKRVSVHQFNDSAAGTWTFEAQASGDTGTGSTSPLSTTTTASVTADADLLVLGLAMWRNGTNAPADIAWTESLTDIVDHAGASNEITHSLAWKTTGTGGTFDSEVSWTGTGHEASAAIVVFDTAAGGGGGSSSVRQWRGGLMGAGRF